MNSYLKSFVIGSSYLVFLPFFVGVKNDSTKKYSYYHYTLVAPLWLGMCNMFSLFLANTFKLSLRKRFLAISILSSLSIITIATLDKSYDFSKKGRLQYYLGTFLGYMFVWNIVIYNIEKYLRCKK